CYLRILDQIASKAKYNYYAIEKPKRQLNYTRMKNIKRIGLMLIAIFALGLTSLYAQDAGNATTESFDNPKFIKWADQHPKQAKQFYTFAEKHPEAARWFYNEARENPQAAKQLLKEARKNPEAAKKAYKAAQENPGKARTAVKAAEHNPKKARNAAKKSKKNPKE